MTRALAWLTAAFTALVGLLVGVLVSGARSSGESDPTPQVLVAPSQATASAPGMRPLPIPGSVNFADIAERLNPVVVNIDASARGRRTRPPGEIPRRPEIFEDPSDR